LKIKKTIDEVTLQAQQSTTVSDRSSMLAQLNKMVTSHIYPLIQGLNDPNLKRAYNIFSKQLGLEIQDGGSELPVDMQQQTGGEQMKAAAMQAAAPGGAMAPATLAASIQNKGDLINEDDWIGEADPGDIANLI
jgi:hypothetical protein